MSAHLPDNLRYLCAERGSVAQVCREIGINQQQFGRYLSGRARPSDHNLRRIARHFAVRDEDLLAPPDELIRAYRRGSARPGGLHDPLFDAFPGELPVLRRFLGAYRTYNLSSAAPGEVVIATTTLEEREGLVYSRTLDAVLTRAEGVRQGSRYEGKAAYRGERLFVVEFEAEHGGSFVMTTLFPPHRYRRRYLFGMTAFLAAHPHRTPYASRTVWERLNAPADDDEPLRDCGMFPLHSSKVGPTIRKYLQGDAAMEPVAPPFDD